MNILWHSVAPWINTGYGRVTREVASRIHNTEHNVEIQCLTSVRKSPIVWHGEVWGGEEFQYPVEIDEPITVHPSSSPEFGAARKHFGVHDLADTWDRSDLDFYFTHFDTWMEAPREMIPELEIPYGSYVIVDHYPAPNHVVEQILNAHEVVCMSRFAKSALSEKGVRAKYIPHGVNTEQYYPIPENEDDYPRYLETYQDTDDEKGLIDLDDRFVVGIVAANHADRKHIPEMMQAFKYFVDRVDDEALLYLHTDQVSATGFDLREVQHEMGIHDDNILWATADLYHDIGDYTLNRYYNMIDVLMNCSRGESWGLTITEAQAAGTPCIVTNFSSMPEQLGCGPDHEYWHQWMENSTGTPGVNFREAPHGLLVDPVIGITREKMSTKHFLCHPEDIFGAIKYYYLNDYLIEDHGEDAREYVIQNYDWEENIVPEFKQIFDEVEEWL